MRWNNLSTWNLSFLDSTFIEVDLQKPEEEEPDMKKTKEEERQSRKRRFEEEHRKRKKIWSFEEDEGRKTIWKMQIRRRTEEGEDNLEKRKMIWLEKRKNMGRRRIEHDLAEEDEE